MNFHSADFRGSDFGGVDFTDAILINANLTEVDVSEMKFDNTDLRGAEIDLHNITSEHELDGAILDSRQKAYLEAHLYAPEIPPAGELEDDDSE